MKNTAENESFENLSNSEIKEDEIRPNIPEVVDTTRIEAVGNEEEQEEILKEIKNSKEIQEPRLENINTVADFIKELEERLENTQDADERVEISYHIARIKGALAMADTRPEKIKVGAAKDGRLSMYDRNQQKIKVDEDLLADIPEYGKLLGLAVKEAEAEKAGFADIGFQQLVIKKSGINSGEFHKKERWFASRFLDKLGKRSDLITLYNTDKPEKLADFFLEKEIGKRLKAEKEIKPEELAPYLAEQFKKGAPILYQKLKRSGYGFRTRVKEIILKLENSK